jgi:hypothetical protein
LLAPTQVPPLQQWPEAHCPAPPSHPGGATQLPPEHVVFPLHGVPVICCRQPSAPTLHVTGVFPLQVEPAVHALVQHCAEPDAP